MENEPEPFDLARLGEVVLNSLAASQMLGHVSPAQSALYFGEGSDPETRFVRDYLAVCAGTDEAATARLRAFVAEQGLADKIAAAVMI